MEILPLTATGYDDDIQIAVGNQDEVWIFYEDVPFLTDLLWKLFNSKLEDYPSVFGIDFE